MRQMEGFHFVFNRLMACGKKLRNIKYDAFLKESGVKVKGSVKRVINTCLLSVLRYKDLYVYQLECPTKVIEWTSGRSESTYFNIIIISVTCKCLKHFYEDPDTSRPCINSVHWADFQLDLIQEMFTN